ncbi:hypothetical protein P152DRAFT_108186 [Eremomyces bilateralis CBS 781.70]|uniref:C3H1-type domain-containing protein n=1 Tax=Eremomyces bilateralis CBS 781.70 TaxID=1392243 RepID=A0A6G1GDP5_9PEZI|nr:uncharacterized protein P152DRAFT_108186 [Eremomyces bilateralis CBS 781.70]KAF1816026.1 hypothetical protein P152DRAFT_108186 [Eremomyces bilateralis CBS 781.70]
MSGLPPPFAPGSGANGQSTGGTSGSGAGAGNARQVRQRPSGDFRRSSTGGSQGAQPVPGGRNSTGGLPAPVQRPFGPASPPNKNTKHVPCKFFRQGACQAGTACPFLHTLDVVTPCKYYQKGNCKFGMKCANQHIMPDGRIANRPNYGMGSSQPPVALGNRVALHSPTTPAPPSSLLTLQAQRNQGPPGAIRPGPNGEYTYGPAQQYMGSMGIGGDMNSLLDPSAHDLGSSPTSMARSYTIRDAPLPESFDPQGVSVIPRTGPMAASVPAHFGIDLASPQPVATGNNKTGSGLSFTSGSPAAGPLRHGTGIDAVVNSRNVQSTNRGFPSFGSSPPTISDDLASGRRTMHSDRYRNLKQPFLSASLGAAGSRSPMGFGPMNSMRSPSGYDAARASDADAGEWDPAMQLDEDLLERDLRASLDIDNKPHKPLTDRRLSRNGEDDAFNMRPLNAALSSPRLDPSSSFRPLGHRHSLSGLGSENVLGSSFGAVGTPGSKVGSPPSGFVGSPSRFSQFFSKSTTKESSTTTNGNTVDPPSNNGAMPISKAPSNPGPSPFGHVGSPLRTASFGVGSPEGDLNAGFSRSPPPHRKNSGSLSVLSQQLQRTKRSGSTTEPSDIAEQPPSRTTADTASLAPAPAPPMKRITSTSSNIPSHGIAETEEEELFEMDVEEGLSPGGGKADAEEKGRGKRSSWQKAWGQGFDGVGRGLGVRGR